MTPGNLVYHKDDIKDDREIPGLVVAIWPLATPERYEAVVHFVDRTVAEVHELEYLIKVKTHEHNRIQKAKAR